jgi:hypothetical protein
LLAFVFLAWSWLSPVALAADPLPDLALTPCLDAQVEITRADGEVLSGLFLQFDAEHAILHAADGTVLVVKRADLVSLRILGRAAPAPEPAPEPEPPAQREKESEDYFEDDLEDEDW